MAGHGHGQERHEKNRHGHAQQSAAFHWQEWQTRPRRKRLHLLALLRAGGAHDPRGPQISLFRPVDSGHIPRARRPITRRRLGGSVEDIRLAVRTGCLSRGLGAQEHRRHPLYRSKNPHARHLPTWQINERPTEDESGSHHVDSLDAVPRAESHRRPRRRLQPARQQLSLRPGSPRARSAHHWPLRRSQEEHVLALHPARHFRSRRHGREQTCVEDYAQESAVRPRLALCQDLCPQGRRRHRFWRPSRLPGQVQRGRRRLRPQHKAL